FTRNAYTLRGVIYHFGGWALPRRAACASSDRRRPISASKRSSSAESSLRAWLIRYSAPIQAILLLTASKINTRHGGTVSRFDACRLRDSVIRLFMLVPQMVDIP